MNKVSITIDKEDNKKALFVYLLVLLSTMILGFVVGGLPYVFANDLPRILFSSLFVFSILLSVFCLCKKDHTDFKAILYNKNTFGKSFVYGVLFSFVAFLLQGGMKLFAVGVDLHGQIGIIVWNLFYYLCLIGFFEEVIFRGYIAKKFFVHNKTVSMLLVGLMFTFAHIPFNLIVGMLINHMSIPAFLHIYFFSFVFDFFFHILMQIFYDKYHNCIGPVLVHTVINFTSWLVLNCS